MSFEGSDHLLRTFASVPPSNRVLVLAPPGDRHPEFLTRLGLDVYACLDSSDDVTRLRRELAPLLEQDVVERNVSVARPHALGFPDEYFDWLVSYHSFGNGSSSLEQVMEALIEGRRVLKSGGWIYIAMASGTDEAVTDDERIMRLYGLMQRAGFELAEKAEVEKAGTGTSVRGIFRRVDAGTPL